VTEVFTLRRLIPICCYCRKVRDDQDYWRQVESYLHQTCNLKFSHGICPECMEEMVRRGEIPPDTPPDR
jgi:hypothetical protein